MSQGDVIIHAYAKHLTVITTYCTECDSARARYYKDYSYTQQKNDTRRFVTALPTVTFYTR